jgi:hypothetical protein
MSLRSRLALIVATAALVIGTAACSGGSNASSEPAEPTLPPAEAAACAATTAFADAVLQFEGVDVAAIGASNLAPQINRLRGTYTAVNTSLEFVDVPGEAALAESWATFEVALGAIDQTAPTQEQVDAAKAAGADVKTDFAEVQSQLGCPPATP